MLFGPEPFREALGSRLQACGFDAQEAAEQPPFHGDEVYLVHCGSESGWNAVASLGRTVPTVAVITAPRLESYARALAYGAGVVAEDNPTAVIVDVVRATLGGDVLLPASVGEALASGITNDAGIARSSAFRTSILNASETALAQLVVQRKTNEQMAVALAYSARTVRRKLQNLYIKLNVTNRAEAIVALRELAELDDHSTSL